MCLFHLPPPKRQTHKEGNGLTAGAVVGNPAAFWPDWFTSTFTSPQPVRHTNAGLILREIFGVARH